VVNDFVGNDSDDETAHKKSKTTTLSWDEMGQLRSDLYMQLKWVPFNDTSNSSDARNELWFVLELAKTLAESSPFTNQPPAYGAHHASRSKAKDQPPGAARVGDPPVLPPGTYSTTPSVAPMRSLHLEALDLEIALAAKQRALDDCSATIDAAVEELKIMAAAGQGFWQSLRELREGRGGKGQWAIVPKPDFGRNMLEGETAKDVVIPYAVDEGEC
jgi:hypothetical protein